MTRGWMILAIVLCLDGRAFAQEPPPAKAINQEKLNTDADEEEPAPTTDHLGLFFTKKTKKHYDIFLARRSSLASPFGAGKPFLFERGADVRSPFFHKGKLYFATNAIPDRKFADLQNFDVQWQTGTQAAFFIPGDVNSKADEMYPWVTPAGKELYFSRKTDDGWKLFMANGPTPGPIGKSKDVGFPPGFHRAAVAGNGLTMYMQGPLEKDKTGIFRSKRAKVGAAWSKPEPVTALNHPDSKKGDMHPALTSDGARLYFVSDRPGGKGGLDIWSVSTTALK